MNTEQLIDMLARGAGPAPRMNAVLDVRICAQDTTCLSIRVDEDNAAVTAATDPAGRTRVTAPPGTGRVF